MSEANASDLSWFYQLHPHLQVRLLRNPRGALSNDLAVRFALPNGPGVCQDAHWVSGGEPGSLRLAGGVAGQLEVIREQLDHWWSSNVRPEDRAYIIEHRAGELEKGYGAIVRLASSDRVGPDACLIPMVSEHKGAFRLPEIIRAYVEMKAIEGA
ncbi:hypothetical protein [Mycolicibacter senuensis]|uniref:hypothetical protein n=1 Tax=Mycolicibacter senuensis TaxID=386913 RepID=UPI000DCDD752|nr:hypothetical protein [Mycolicibacter senuensis]RAU99471.1 hypothetical protein DQP56_10655 [Mycolicibacter senuensis]